MDSVLTRTHALFSEAVIQVYEKMAGILPEAILAVLIVIGGWIVASLVYALTLKALEVFAVDKLVAKTPLDRMLKNIGLKKSASEILGLLVFWLTILVTLISASEILHLEQVSSALTKVTAYIPQVIAAFLIIIFGMLFAKFLQTIIVESLSRSKLGYERSVGKIVQIIVIVFVFLAAFEQLGIDLSFVTTNVLIVVAAVLLIVGLSFVLGARNVLENILACQQLKRLLIVDSEIIIGDMRGRIKGYTISGVILTVEQGEAVVPATAFFKQTYTLLK